MGNRSESELQRARGDELAHLLHDKRLVRERHAHVPRAAARSAAHLALQHDQHEPESARVRLRVGVSRQTQPQARGRVGLAHRREPAAQRGLEHATLAQQPVHHSVQRLLSGVQGARHRLRRPSKSLEKSCHIFL